MNVNSLVRIAALLSAFWLYPAFAGNPFAGANVYTEHCAKCHGTNGRALIAGVPNIVGGKVQITPDGELRAVIETGKGIMPSYRGVLTSEQIDDVIAHLRTLF